MTALKPFPKYKDSGAPWLGDVPADWSVVRAKSVLKERKTKSGPTDVHLTPSQTFGVLPQAEYMERTGNKVVLNLTGADDMRHVERNDFISHLRSFQGGLEYSPMRGKVSAAYTVLEPLSGVAPAYFRYLFKSSRYIQALQTTTDQLRDGQSIRFAQLGLLPLPLPELEIQHKVADFLDRETAEIDEFIADQEELIGLLAERRAATISLAVTKGLDPTVPMKASGIEWIGKLPSHWILPRLSYIVRCSSGLGIEISSLEPERSSEAPFPVYGGNGIVGFGEESNVSSGNLAIGRVGALCGNVHSISESAWVSDNALRLILDPSRLDQSFARNVLTARRLNELADKTAQPLITGSLITAQKIPEPPLAEQRAIADHIGAETGQIDASIADAEEAIALSQERRAALISAAVTGKIDVRDYGVVA